MLEGLTEVAEVLVKPVDCFETCFKKAGRKADREGINKLGIINHFGADF